MKIQAMAGYKLNDTVIDDIIHTISKKNLKKVTILDLGSGQGYNALILSQKLNLHNIEFAITCVDIDKNQFKLENQAYTTFVQANLNEDLLIGKFDIVIGTEIIEHIENPYHFINLCISHLVQNGICYITTPNVEHVFSLIKQLILARPMWFSVNEPSGHITPIHNFMIHESLRRINTTRHSQLTVQRFFNRNCFPFQIKKGRLVMTTLPGNNRVFGEINIFKIY